MKQPFLIFIFFFIFVFTYFFSKYYVDGDQLGYNNAYEAVNGLDLSDAFISYQFYITSSEPIHFFVIWIFSNLNIDKNLIMAFFNACLACIIGRILILKNVNLFLIFVLLTTNYYLYGLYFAAERLKISFLLLFLAVLYINNKRIRIPLVLISILTHIQILILILSFIFSYFFKSFSIPKKFSLIFKNKNYIVLAFLFFPIFYLKDHILYKFNSYSNITSSSFINNIWQPVIFAILAYLYSNEKKSTILVFSIIILCSNLVGPTRITMMAYIVFLFYSLNYNRGLSYVVILTTIYFSLKSIIFIYNVLNNGHAF